jgi:hypothetical protein
MGNLKRLMDAGIVTASASLNAEDQELINSLSSAEVDALISIKSKLTPGFVQRNLSGGGAGLAPSKQSIGIVF